MSGELDQLRQEAEQLKNQIRVSVAASMILFFSERFLCELSSFVAKKKHTGRVSVKRALHVEESNVCYGKYRPGRG